MRIKKTSQYIEGGTGLPSYFTTETDTGMKWIDGKTIYRKVVEYQPTATIGAVGQATNISIPHNVTNMEQCTKCDMFTNSHYRFPVGGGSTNVSSLTLVTAVHPTAGITVRIINDTWQSTNKFYFVIEYTKTTD